MAKIKNVEELYRILQLSVTLQKQTPAVMYKNQHLLCCTKTDTTTPGKLDRAVGFGITVGLYIIILWTSSSDKSFSHLEYDSLYNSLYDS